MKHLIFIYILLTSCSVDHEVEGLDKGKVEVVGSLEPDFKGTADFCDDRYGEYSDKAEECFQDYRDYYKAIVGIDLDSIVNFCEERYDDVQYQDECINNLIDILGK